MRRASGEADLRTALAVALEAVSDAGARLRAELHRPGGPRSAGHHAAIDGEVGDLLRTRLRGRCRWSWRSKEGDGVEVSSCAYRWLVQPHDGTAQFLKRRRGSAIAIGLLRDGQPVLGVVHAFAYPDEAGDLITWAESCGPVRRNSVETSAPLGGLGLGDGPPVALSTAAAARPSVNAELVAPARFLALPSIAYRLALTAVGEAVAAVSLNRPVDWDLAAGHALTRAAGGILLDQDGEPIRYDADGRATTSFCFGGAPAAVRALWARPWARALAGGPEIARAGPPARPTADARGLDRARGCLLGQLAGDALGGLVEFQEPSAISRHHPDGPRDLADGGTWGTLAGQPTDDSELALALARTLVAERRWNAASVHAAYVKWFRSGPFDCGSTIAGALASGVPSRTTPSNGSLMRVSPIGIFAAGDPVRAADLAAADSVLTHAHPSCVAACRAYAAAIAVGVAGGAVASMVEAALALAGDGKAAETVRARIDLAREAPPPDFVHHMGWVLTALQNAFHRLMQAPSLEEGVVATVRCGGDTDTNAAIAGALLGALHGGRAIPARWRRALLTCRPLAQSGARHSRPAIYWPDDVLDLAEALLVAGGDHEANR